MKRDKMKQAKKKSKSPIPKNSGGKEKKATTPIRKSGGGGKKPARRRTGRREEGKESRVLILENNPADAELMEHQLKKAGIDFISRRVDNRNGFLQALKKFKPDLILADYKLPRFDALSALKLRKKNAPLTPFIVVTGSISEEIAVACMKQGADDYLLKDRLARLGEAVRNSLANRRLQAEKKTAEESLRANELLYRTFIDSSTDMAFLKDDHFRHLLANQVLCRFYGKPENKIVGKTDFELMGKSAAAKYRRSDKQALTENRINISEETVNGLTFETRKFPVKLIDGRIGVGGYIRDISEHKRTQDQIEQATRKWTITFDAIKDGIALLAVDQTIKQVNRAFANLVNKSFKEIIGKKCYELVHPNRQPDPHCSFAKMLKSKNRESMELAKDDRIFEVVVDPITNDAGDISGAAHIMSDITERKNMEVELKDSEIRYHNLFENSSEFIYTLDLKGNFTDVNKAALTLTGYTKSELLKMNFKNYTPKRDHRKLFLTLSKIYKTGKPFQNLLIEAIIKDKSKKYFETSISLMKKGEQIIGFQGSSKDITKRKLAEEALLEMNEIFRLFLKHNPIYVFIKDENIRPVYLSDNYEKLLGRPVSELLGKSMDELFPSELSCTMIEDDKRILREGVTCEFIEELNDRIYSTIKFPIFILGKAKYLAGYTMDITERKLAEEQVQASLLEKEVLLKEIHHRVKNNLQIISGLLTLQAAQINDERLQRMLKESQSRIWTMALIHQTLYQSGNLADIDMADYIRSLAGNLLSSHAQIAMPPTVSFDLVPVQLVIDKAIPLALIINELVTNAMKHAFPVGRPGEIRIILNKCSDKSRLVTTENAGTNPTDGENAPTFELTVADNGAGLPAGFDPKNQKSLGLQLVTMLTKQLGGSLAIESSGGTSVHIIFSNNEKNEKQS